jgi:hypothetical protein
MRFSVHSRPRSRVAIATWMVVGLCAVLICGEAEAKSRRKKRGAKKPAAASVESSSASASEADANTDVMRVVVVPVDGKDGVKFRALMVRAIEKAPNYTVVPTDEVNQAADKLGVMLGSEARDYSAIAAEVKASAIVTGKVSQARRKATFDVQVRNGVDGEVLGDSSWSAKNTRVLQKQVKKTFWKKTGGVIAMGTAPQSEQDSSKLAGMAAGAAGARSAGAVDSERAPGLGDATDESAAAAQQQKDDEPSSKSTADVARLALDVQAGIGFFTRKLTYNEPLYGVPPEYSLGGAPAAHFAGDFYPLALLTDSFASNIALTGTFWQGFAMKSQSESDSSIEYPTNAWAYTLGGKVRIPFDNIDLQIFGAYGEQLFSIKADGSNPRPDVPNVRYSFVRTGLGTRFDFSKHFFAGAQAAYLFVMDTGEIGSAAYFPNASAGAVDGQLSFGYKLGGGLELRAQGDFRRYFFSMNPEVGDARVAGGAVDQYLSGTLAVAYRWMKE